MLDLKAALDKIDTGSWLSIAVVAADTKKGTYGEIIRITRCRKLTRKNTSSGKGVPGYFPSDNGKDPNHDDHFTRNVILPNRSIRKIHIRLLFAINGERVI